MTRRKIRNEGKKSAKFFSGLFLATGLSILVMIGMSLGKETYRKRQIQKEIENLQAEIQKINQENIELSNLISYFSSQEFQEKEARENLNLQKEDEKMIILRKDAIILNEEKSDGDERNLPVQENKTPNWQKWLEFFFAEKN